MYDVQKSWLFFGHVKIEKRKRKQCPTVRYGMLPAHQSTVISDFNESGSRGYECARTHIGRTAVFLIAPYVGPSKTRIRIKEKIFFSATWPRSGHVAGASKAPSAYISIDSSA